MTAATPTSEYKYCVDCGMASTPGFVHVDAEDTKLLAEQGRSKAFQHAAK
jgi:hypothetical protein